MKILVVASGLLFCVAMATAQAPQAPPVTPMKFSYYPSTDLKALANTLKGGGQMFDPVIISIVEQTKGALLQTNPQLAKDLNEVAAQLRNELAPRRDEPSTTPAKRYASRVTEAEW